MSGARGTEGANGLHFFCMEEEDRRGRAVLGGEGTNKGEQNEEKRKRKGVTAPKALSEKALKRFTAKQKAKGIVYLSRLPPHMKPQKVRHLLSDYGEIGRVYLAAEDVSVRALRREKRQGGDKRDGEPKAKGSSGKRYTEGWVEFNDKKEAKIAAQLLNGEPMGGKKRASHYYDLWCIKYLPKFEWDHLTEELNHQRAVLESKVAAEVAAANRERDFYLSRVDKAKAVASIIERRAVKEGDEAGGGSTHGARDSGSTGGDGKKKKARGPVRSMTFGQKDVIEKEKKAGVSLGVLKKLAGTN